MTSKKLTGAKFEQLSQAASQGLCDKAAIAFSLFHHYQATALELQRRAEKYTKSKDCDERTLMSIYREARGQSEIASSYLQKAQIIQRNFADETPAPTGAQGDFLEALNLDLDEI